MNASPSPTEVERRAHEDAWRSHLNHRWVAIVATVAAVAIAAGLVFLMMRAAEALRPLGMVLWVVLVGDVALSVVIVRWLWRRARATRPEPLADPDAEPEHQPHLGLSGQIEPPTRW